MVFRASWPRERERVARDENVPRIRDFRLAVTPTFPSSLYRPLSTLVSPPLNRVNETPSDLAIRISLVGIGGVHRSGRK